MGNKKKKKNSNYHQQKTRTVPTVKDIRKTFDLRDILCILAALLFIGSWVYNNEIGEIPMAVTAGIYIAIAVLLGLYFFISPKFQHTWKHWNKHIKIYLIILVLGDILALVSYDIMSNILYLAILVVVNFVYYALFLRNRTDEDIPESKQKTTKTLKEPQNKK